MKYSIVECDNCGEQFIPVMGNTTCPIVDMKDINLNFGIMPKFHPLPDLGGGPRGYVQSYMGQMVGNPLKHGAFKPTAA